MGLKAVIFDMDGVIVDTEPEYLRVETELIKELNISVSEEELKEFSGINPLIMWQKIKEKYNLEKAAQELYLKEAELMERYYEKGALKAIKPTVDLIKELYRNGYKTAVASSSEKVNILHTLIRLKIKRYFDAIVSNNDVQNCKPKPDIYLLAARLLGTEPKDCVVIEDSIAGVIAAKDAGMKVIRYVSGENFDQRGCDADFTVTDITQITLPLILDIATKNNKHKKY